MEYITPKMEIIDLEEDIIMESLCDEDGWGCENDTPPI